MVNSFRINFNPKSITGFLIAAGVVTIIMGTLITTFSGIDTGLVSWGVVFLILGLVFWIPYNMDNLARKLNK